jgi:phage baseplate assembly protein W
MATQARPRAIYRGFSTQFHLNNPTFGFQITDAEVIKQDLLNHIYTIPGERVMLPNFGTRIPLMAFEPLDQLTLSIVEEDLRRVINYDPRVELVSISVQALPNNNAIIAFVDIRYLNLGIQETLKLEFPTAS